MIRSAAVVDVAAIAVVEVHCFGAEAWSEGLVLAEVEGDRRTVLVSDDKTTIDGYASISVMDEVADLHRIAVLSASRRRGLARELLNDVIDRAREQGATRMLLEVADGNTAAITLYESSRFVTISRRSHYYPSGADSLVMALTI